MKYLQSTKAFNENLNLSYSSEIAHEKWTEYRKQVSGFVADALKSGSDNCLVIGSGHLNDIDIEVLLHTCKHISLLDIDMHSTRKALKYLEIPEQLFDLLEYDLTCFESNDRFETLVDSLELYLSTGNSEPFIDYVKEHNIHYGLEYYDALIIMPVYTQILFQQLLHISKEYLSYIGAVLTDDISMTIMSMVAELLRKINAELMRHVKPDGTVIVLTDVLEYDSGSDEYRTLKEHFENDNMDGIDEHYRGILGTHGFSLGSFGLYDVSQKINESASTFFMWDFNDERKLLVKAISGTKAES